jgi:hypothetical protein
MQIARRLDAGKNPFNEGHCHFPLKSMSGLVCQ